MAANAKPKIQISWQICATGTDRARDMVFGIGLCWWHEGTPKMIHARTFPLRLSKRDDISWKQHFDERGWTRSDLWSDEYLDWFQGPFPDRYYCRIGHLISDVSKYIENWKEVYDIQVVLTRPVCPNYWTLDELLKMYSYPTLEQYRNVDVQHYEEHDLLERPVDDRVLVGFNGGILLTHCPLHPSCAAADVLMRYRCLYAYDECNRQKKNKI